MTRSRSHGEEGQIFPILLLVMVVLVTFGFAIIQLGSAGDQKTQTQSAADSGALAAAKALAGNLLLALPVPLLDIVGRTTNPATAGYAAAEQSWSLNHQDQQLNAADVVTNQVDIVSVEVTVTAPAGVIVGGPVRGTGTTRPVATATATIRLTCQSLGGALNPLLNLLHDVWRLPGVVCPVPAATTTTTTTMAPGPMVPPPPGPPPQPLTVNLTDVLPLLDVVLVA